jgi:hypothetical protein
MWVGGEVEFAGDEEAHDFHGLTSGVRAPFV